MWVGKTKLFAKWAANTVRHGERSEGGETPIGNAVCIFVVRSASE